MPPKALFVRGKIPSVKRSVGIVGSRAADGEALSFAFELARALAEQGCTIVSGGALGVDSAAHRGALAAGAPTLALLATGLVSSYPPQNESLFERIAEQGALASEVEGEVTPLPARFIQRNRLIAALSRVVVVVQAPSRSGALSTASEGRKLRRPLLVVPDAPWRLQGQGGLRILKAAHAGLCLGPKDVLNALDELPTLPLATLAKLDAAKPARRKHSPSVPSPSQGKAPAPRAKRQRWDALSDEERRLLEILRSRAYSLDELSATSTLPAARLRMLLLRLEMAGQVREEFGGKFSLSEKARLAFFPSFPPRR